MVNRTYQRSATWVLAEGQYFVSLETESRSLGPSQPAAVESRIRPLKTSAGLSAVVRGEKACVASNIRGLVSSETNYFTSVLMVATLAPRIIVRMAARKRFHWPR